MATSASLARPLPLSHGASRRRLEVFSPKLSRRLSLGSYNAWRLWLALEANPEVISFCERPTRLRGHRGPLIDFWAQLRSDPAGEYWVLDHSHDEPESPAEFPRRFHDSRVRVIDAQTLASWEVPLANWARIVPFLVSYRLYRQPLLEQSIAVVLGRSTPLSEILERFSEHDRSLVEASVYWLLATGRVRSPDIAVEPLGVATRFRRS